jgi:enterobactin synthetase component D
MKTKTIAPDTLFASGPRDGFWQLLNGPEDCRGVTTRFSREAGSRDGLDTADIAIPPQLARATPRRLTEFIAGRRCAREALDLLTGAPSYPDMAKDRAPIWPGGIVGSISHCQDRAIAVVGRAERYRGLGVDIEKLLTKAEAQDIAQHALTDIEQQRFGRDINPFAVSLAFSAKESLFKALYPVVRRFCSFNTSELVEWDPHGSALLRLTEGLSPEWPRNREIIVHFSHFDGLLLTHVSIEQ